MIMSIYVGNQKIKEVYCGAQKIKEVYCGSQKVFSTVDTRGHWIHYQTDAKTYFDATASFINNGVMSEPSWIADAKEIKLCAGITDFTKAALSNYTPTTHRSSQVLYKATNLQKFDFGSASVSRAYLSLFGSHMNLTDVVLNSSVTTLEPAFCFMSGSRSSLQRVTIPSSVSYIENGLFFNIAPMEVFKNNPNLLTIYTDPGNTTRLQSMLNGKGLPSNYQIIEV